MRAFLSLLVARNREFLRDRGVLAWNFAFPFVAVAAIGVIFSGGGRDLYKVGVFGANPAVLEAAAGSNGAAPAVRAALLGKARRADPNAALVAAIDSGGRPWTWTLTPTKGST